MPDSAFEYIVHPSLGILMCNVFYQASNLFISHESLQRLINGHPLQSLINDKRSKCHIEGLRKRRGERSPTEVQTVYPGACSVLN